MSGGPIGGWLESLAHLQADGAALVAAARASMTNPQARRTLGANYWSYVGQQAVLLASGRISNVITTPGTARFDLSFGANVVFESLMGRPLGSWRGRHGREVLAPQGGELRLSAVSNPSELDVDGVRPGFSLSGEVR